MQEKFIKFFKYESIAMNEKFSMLFFDMKKFFILLYFAFLIILNIVDFFNIIPNDLDFFKKILSWVLIGYLFYRISITRLLIGYRLKKYDIAFIVSFCFMTIVKSLVLYVRTNAVSVVNFPLFHFVLLKIPDNYNMFIYSMFIVGLLLTIFFSINLIIKNKIHEKSFLGSFNFSQTYFSFIMIHLFSIGYLLFFVLVIFNFFMEWFALAVDSVILVFGLLYYAFKLILHHFDSKVSVFLNDVTNSGNDFYQKLISLFSQKSTFFTGMSFLLLLHLLVDVGVYLVPYTIGTQNTLYFSSLNVLGREHVSLFNFFDIAESRIYYDMIGLNSDYFLIVFLLLYYILSLLFMYLMLLLPFYIYYNNVAETPVKIPYKIKTFVISSFIALCFIWIFLKGLDFPIKIGLPLSSTVKGIDIYTSNIVINNFFNQYVLLILAIFFVLTLFFVSFEFKRHKCFFNKIFYVFVISFFMFYICMYSFSSLKEEFNTLSKVERESLGTDFLDYNNIYSDLNSYKNSRFKMTYRYKDCFNATITAFSDLKVNTGSMVYFSEKHKDFLYFDFYDINPLCDDLFFLSNSNVNFDLKSKYDPKKGQFLSNNISMIYFLGENFYSLKKIDDEKYLVEINLDSAYVGSLFMPDKKNNSLNDIIYFVTCLRLLFLVSFYVAGNIFLFYFFFKKNVFSCDKFD